MPIGWKSHSLHIIYWYIPLTSVLQVLKLHDILLKQKKLPCIVQGWLVWAVQPVRLWSEINVGVGLTCAKSMLHACKRWLPSKTRPDQAFQPTHITFLRLRVGKSAPVRQSFQAAWFSPTTLLIRFYGSNGQVAHWLHLQSSSISTLVQTKWFQRT